MISARSKEEILSASHIEEVIGEFVNLKKRGGNHVGLCPFHTEKTPSFNVSPSKGIFKCFGCGKAGDVVTFLMEHEKHSYPEALRWLAQRYHIAVEITGDVVKEQDDQKMKESLFIINQFAADHFQNNLLKTSEGKMIGLSYFKERGYGEEIIRKFKLGYALKDGEAFTKAALKSEYKSELLERAGLVVQRGLKGADFFHERVIFPILNLSGKVAAFAGRILTKEEKSPKYINSPETEVYKKSQLVYGIYQAKNSIRQHDECFLTEGYTDVISMHVAGIENVVASSGTSLTEDQIKLIRRFTNNITILYDGDAAGVKAALRGLEMMVALDVNVRIVMLPDGHDPDSFLTQSGSTALRDFIQNNKKHFMLFKLELLLKEAGTDPLKKAEAVKEAAKTLSEIPDMIRRAILIKESANLLDVKEQLLLVEVNKLKRKQFKKESGAHPFETDALSEQGEFTGDHAAQLVKQSGDEFQERDIIRLLLEYGKQPMDEQQSVAQYIISEIKEIPFTNTHCRLIIHEFEEQLGKELIPDHHYFSQSPDESLRSLVLEIISSPYSLSDNWKVMHEIFVVLPSENFRKDVISSLERFKLKKVINMMNENLLEMKNKKGNEEEETHYQMIHRKLAEWKQNISSRLGTVVAN